MPDSNKYQNPKVDKFWVMKIKWKSLVEIMRKLLNSAEMEFFISFILPSISLSINYFAV